MDEKLVTSDRALLSLLNVSLEAALAETEKLRIKNEELECKAANYENEIYELTSKLGSLQNDYELLGESIVVDY